MKSIFLTTVIAITFLPLFVQAQATRTWVSGVGDDANPCSRTAPGATIAGAFPKTAPGGVIDVLDPGDFGPVGNIIGTTNLIIITNSITIEGDEAECDIVSLDGTSGIVIAANTNDVVILRNLTFERTNSGLAGVSIVSAGAVHIENCRFNGFSNDGIDFAPTNANSQLFVKDTTIHDCFPSGIFLLPTSSSTVQIEGVDITGSGNGIDASANSLCVINDTTVSGNTGTGFVVGTSSRMTIKNSVSTDNAIGVQSAGVAVLHSSAIVGNTGLGLKTPGTGQILSYGNNMIQGNHPNGSPNGILTSQ